MAAETATTTQEQIAEQPDTAPQVTEAQAKLIQAAVDRQESAVQAEKKPEADTKTEGKAVKAKETKQEKVLTYHEKQQKLGEIASNVSSTHRNAENQIVKPGRFEVIFAKFFMMTHPGLKLQEIMNGGRLPANPNKPENVLYRKYSETLDADKYCRKKAEYFPETETVTAPETSPVAA